ELALQLVRRELALQLVRRELALQLVRRELAQLQARPTLAQLQVRPTLVQLQARRALALQQVKPTPAQLQTRQAAAPLLRTADRLKPAKPDSRALRADPLLPTLDLLSLARADSRALGRPPARQALVRLPPTADRASAGAPLRVSNQAHPLLARRAQLTTLETMKMMKTLRVFTTRMWALLEMRGNFLADVYLRICPVEVGF
ncbi:hypothetical protein PMIN06_012018, partial [Paraphaeosphaeria minitans]